MSARNSVERGLESESWLMTLVQDILPRSILARSILA